MLADYGFPSPVEMMTGNGVHLVYPIDPTPSGRCLPGDPVSHLLQMIGKKWSLPGVTIDLSTFNPSRLLRIPGTLNRKGQATPDRPYRPARILRVPHDWQRPEYVAELPAPAAKPEPPPAPERGRDRGTSRPKLDGGKPATARGTKPAAGLFDPGQRGSAKPVH